MDCDIGNPKERKRSICLNLAVMIGQDTPPPLRKHKRTDAGPRGGQLGDASAAAKFDVVGMSADRQNGMNDPGRGDGRTWQGCNPRRLMLDCRDKEDRLKEPDATT
jgi:hypothetical protein